MYKLSVHCYYCEPISSLYSSSGIHLNHGIKHAPVRMLPSFASPALLSWNTWPVCTSSSQAHMHACMHASTKTHKTSPYLGQLASVQQRFLQARTNARTHAKSTKTHNNFSSPFLLPGTIRHCAAAASRRHAHTHARKHQNTQHLFLSSPLTWDNPPLSSSFSQARTHVCTQAPRDA
jgi:hypothetical protein